MEFRVLGPLDVVEGDRGVPIGGARERALLAMLLINAGQVIAAERLIEQLWSAELPANPSNALHVVVSRVRKALELAGGTERLVTRKPGYVLEVSVDEVDAGRFERLVALAREALPVDAPLGLSLLERALGLWRGPAFAEFAGEDFARDEIARLAEERWRAVEMMMSARLDIGQDAELVGELRTLVVEHPLRERLHGHLMLALYRSGRQGEALRAFAQARGVLVAELGVEPGPELRELHRQILVQARSLVPVSESLVPKGNVPAVLTSFVGRHAELGTIGQLVRERRLVTLTGPGGCGKTRLAIELAKSLLGSFSDGVWLVELASVGDPALVLPTLATVVGVPEGPQLGMGGTATKPQPDMLADYLRGKEMLVVLDNCEHLVDACGRLAEELLQSAPKVRVLATSRERLGVSGEALLPVAPLPVPEAQERDMNRIARFDAVRLFVDRARAVRPGFTLDATNAAVVRGICRRLDGIPLAIELAAAHVRVLPPQQIATRLDDHFGRLTSGARTALPRHRTLWAAIDWSHKLLAAHEREMFARLSVFVGGCTLEAAERVCGTGEALDSLTRLVDQSLVMSVVAANEDHARFRMLETIRRYASERLADSGHTDELRRRHTSYFLSLAEEAEPMMRGAQQATWLRRLQADHENIGAAIDWAVRDDPGVAVRITSALAYFWLIGRRRSEVRQRLAHAVEAARIVPPAQRARALGWAAMLAGVEGKPGLAADQARKAHELAGIDGDPWLVAFCMAIYGLTVGFSGETGAASELLAASRAGFESIGDSWGAALADVLLGYASTFGAEHDQAEALARRGLDGFRVAGDRWGQTMALELLGLLARRRSAFDDAVAAYEEALGVVRDLGLRDEVPFLLADLGELQLHRGDAESAAVLYKEALSVAQDLGARDAIALVRSGLAAAARQRGDYGRARELHLQAQSFYRETGLGAELARSLAALGHVAELMGDPDVAGTYHQESLRLARGLSDAAPLAIALEGLASVAAGTRPQRTAVLLGAADAVRARSGIPHLPQERADVDRAADAAVDALGTVVFAALQEKGRRMTIEQAAEYQPDTN